MPTLLIVIGSTRPGRAGGAVAEWFTQRARQAGSFEVDVADLAEINLPFLDEPNHPRLRQYTHAHTRRWSARVEAADAVVFVTPEYNHSFPATLKNALDFLHHEWQYRPAGFVSYGGVSAGTRAALALRAVLSALRMYLVADAVNVPFFTQFLDDEGRVQPNEVMEQAADALLAELARVEQATRPLRARD